MSMRTLPPIRVGSVDIDVIVETELQTPAGGGLLKPEAIVDREARTGRPVQVQDAGPELAELSKRAGEVGWMGRYTTPSGQLRLSFQAFVIKTATKRIVVDTCVGNDKDRASFGAPPEKVHMRQGPFLEQLEESVPAAAVDYVMCTHMHWDHVGWSSMWRGGRWVPTFPRAKYLFGKKEYDGFVAQTKEDGAHGDVARVLMRDSIGPVIQAQLHQLVPSDYVIVDEPGCKVYLKPTEGHTPGHVSVVVESGGETALITGDAMHHPMQVAYPKISSFYDADSQQSARTRQELCAEACSGRTIVIGTHFAHPCAGTLVPDPSPS
eukprot:TRINITY_DN2851_c1_g1_i2.p1 TRINITY_DN2851_c1_g1~~TRINITY_DN2851_c1_g1_i2.p1  ORF type:complete len:322 (+),score=84.84 TRINITY_DN2851_c1_g1_i2:71-1036(+)